MPHDPGSSGPAVRRLQQRLRELHFNPGALDGESGLATEAAVLAFQRSEGLLPDGIAGPRTLPVPIAVRLWGRGLAWRRRPAHGPAVAVCVSSRHRAAPAAPASRRWPAPRRCEGCAGGKPQADVSGTAMAGKARRILPSMVTSRVPRVAVRVTNSQS